jgi:deoxyribodipyrimidine photolyase-related protein
MKRLRIILWDQLTASIASLENIHPQEDLICFLELREFCTSVLHHKKKLVFLLSAMRHFAEELRLQGHSIEYVALDNPDNPLKKSGSVGLETINSYKL